MGDLREALSKALESFDVEERSRQMWEQVFTAEKDVLVKAVPIICRSCAKRHIYDITVPVPDLVKRTKALEVLANQAFGKPAERLEVDLTAKTIAELESLPTEELARLAAGELRSLPPSSS